MNITIRLFKRSDEKALIEMFQTFQDYLAGMDTHHHSRRKKDFDAKGYFQETLKRIKKSKGEMWVAENSKSEIVGLIAGILIDEQSKIESLEEHGHKKGKILELYVNESYQGQGIGRRLMEVMEEYFKENGCESFLVECFGPNKKAYDFYQKCGYENRMILLLKPNRSS